MKSSVPSGKLLTYDQALAKVLAVVPRLGVEEVGYEQALGRVLAEDVQADRDQPPFCRSAMDGFAGRAEKLVSGARLPIVGTLAAGAAPVFYGQVRSVEEASERGVMRVATGAAVPVGLGKLDAVIAQEQVTVEGNVEGQQVMHITGTTVKRGANIHEQAADAKCGQVIVGRGTRVAAHHVGLLAAVGKVKVKVMELPRISTLSTGDELREPETATHELTAEQIRNSNGPMVQALLRAMPVKWMGHEHVRDEAQQTLAAAREALSRSHVVISTGGVSVGQRDWLPRVWPELGLTTVLHGVNIQPGKPVLVMRDENKLTVGLPGNPVSVLCTFGLFVVPVVQAMTGWRGGPRWRKLPLREACKTTDKREVFRAARWHEEGTVSVMAWHGSGDLVHTAEADGWVRLPQREGVIEAGEHVFYLALNSG